MITCGGGGMLSTLLVVIEGALSLLFLFPPPLFNQRQVFIGAQRERKSGKLESGVEVQLSERGKSSRKRAFT